MNRCYTLCHLAPSCLPPPPYQQFLPSNHVCQYGHACPHAGSCQSKCCHHSAPTARPNPAASSVDVLRTVSNCTKPVHLNTFRTINLCRDSSPQKMCKACVSACVSEAGRYCITALMPFLSAARLYRAICIGLIFIGLSKVKQAEPQHKQACLEMNVRPVLLRGDEGLMQCQVQ